MNFKSLKKKVSSSWKKFVSFFDARPLTTFFGFLGLLLMLVIVGSFLRKPIASTQQAAPEPKLVETYGFGDSPKMTFSAKIEKSGVISVYAQSPGVVQKLNQTEGKRVSRGTTLVSLSTNYQGANVASLSKAIAQKSYDNANDNYAAQLDILQRQRDIARNSTIMAGDMRQIQKDSLSDTKSLIDLNQSIIDSLNAQINSLTASNVNGANDAAILGAKQGVAAATAGLLNLKASYRTTQYQTQDSTVSAKLSDQSRDLTLAQLDLQEKGLTLSKDIAELNLKLAKVSESLMYPASPVNGTVQRVYVKVGQSVSPGTLIATIRADKGENSAVVLVPQTIAKQISTMETSDFLIGGKKVSIAPRFVSSEATDGNLFSVLYAIPATYADQLVNTGTVQVAIPMGGKKIVVDDLSIPLDSIYQTTDKSYVYVKKDDKAVVKEVTLGEISGSYVKVTSGLTANDVVIVSRTVQEGDAIRTE